MMLLSNVGSSFHKTTMKMTMRFCTIACVLVFFTHDLKVDWLFLTSKVRWQKKKSPQIIGTTFNCPPTPTTSLVEMHFEICVLSYLQLPSILFGYPFRQNPSFTLYKQHEALSFTCSHSSCSFHGGLCSSQNLKWDWHESFAWVQIPGCCKQTGGFGLMEQLLSGLYLDWGYMQPQTRKSYKSEPRRIQTGRCDLSLHW